MRHRFRVRSSQPPSINNNPSIARMHQAASAPNSSQTDYNSICSPRWRWAKVSWWAHRRWPWWLLDENQVRRRLRRSTRVRQGTPTVGWSAAVLTLRQFTPRQAKGADIDRAQCSCAARSHHLRLRTQREPVGALLLPVHATPVVCVDAKLHSNDIFVIQIARPWPWNKL